MTKDNSTASNQDTSSNLQCNCQSNTSYTHLPSKMMFADYTSAIMCRINNKFRMRYTAVPGLYALGSPGKDSPVLVTANYKLSLDALRTALQGRDVWILVVDTKGINVWCAAGKGTFNTMAIVKQITESNLSSVVTHRLLILPQLGASGVAAHKLQKESGFTVKFGPALASDLPQYLDNSNKATIAMRRIRFSFVHRAKLVPMEGLPALKKVLLYLFIAAVLFGITPTGILYKQAITGVLPIVIAGLTAIFTGAILTPLFLPIIPFKAFSSKGFLTGLIGALAIILFLPVYRNNIFLTPLILVAVPAFSSYLAFLFTGSSTYTSPSGVKAELKFAWPYYLVSAGISIVLFVIVLIKHWGIL